MRFGLLLLIICCSGGIFAQSWEDDLARARRYYKNKQYQQAYDQYHKVEKTAPEGVDLSDEMGQSAYKANQFKEAEEWYRKSSSASGTKEQRASNFHNVGNACLKQKKYQEAISAYKDALRLNPENEQARYNLMEARRRLEAERKKQQQKQQDQQKDDEKDNKTADNQQKKQNQPKQTPKQQKPSDKPGDQQQQGNPGEKNRQGDKETATSRLTDRKTERTLDELTRKEAETKRKLGGRMSRTGAKKSRKDW